jgi:hypothetical protein
VATHCQFERKDQKPPTGAFVLSARFHLLIRRSRALQGGPAFPTDHAPHIDSPDTKAPPRPSYQRVCGRGAIIPAHHAPSCSSENVETSSPNPGAVFSALLMALLKQPQSSLARGKPWFAWHEKPHASSCRTRRAPAAMASRKCSMKRRPGSGTLKQRKGNTQQGYLHGPA